MDIKVGESIPKRIAEGLDECDVVVVLLTKKATQSNWAETEWQSKYWDEVRSGAVRVIPMLLEKCEIPRLLAHKKYADFRDAYGNGLDDLLLALRGD